MAEKSGVLDLAKLEVFLSGKFPHFKFTYNEEWNGLDAELLGSDVTFDEAGEVYIGDKYSENPIPATLIHTLSQILTSIEKFRASNC